MKQLHSVCVYCGSSKGNDPIYERVALNLADFMANHGMRLVNGGGSIGLMGVMADRMLEHNAECVGVIPQSLKEKEVAHLGMTELHITSDMHSRKLKMVNLSDAFIALPGGFGTLDELFETLTWTQLHLHNKPIGVLNVNGYFDPLVQMATQMVNAGFLRTDGHQLLRVADTIQALFDQLRNPIMHHAPKWT